MQYWKSKIIQKQLGFTSNWWAKASISTSENQLVIVTVLHICEGINSEIIKHQCFLPYIHLTGLQRACLKKDKKQKYAQYIRIHRKWLNIKNVNISLYQEQIHLPKTENDQFQEPSMDAPGHPRTSQGAIGTPRTPRDPPGSSSFVTWNSPSPLTFVTNPD